MGAITQKFHVLGLICGLRKPNTHLTDDETRALLEHLSQAQARTIVEIGVYEAATTLKMAQSTSGHVYGVDPFQPISFFFSPMPLVVKILANRAGAENITFLRKTSAEAAADFTNSVDFLFVDGDHSWTGIQTDVECWFPKMKPGGLLCFHDTVRYGHRRNDGLESFDYFEKQLSRNPGLELVQTADSLSIFRKISP